MMHGTVNIKYCIYIFVYIRDFFLCVMKEQFHSIKMHRINAVKIEELITDEYVETDVYCGLWAAK